MVSIYFFKIILFLYRSPLKDVSSPEESSQERSSNEQLSTPEKSLKDNKSPSNDSSNSEDVVHHETVKERIIVSSLRNLLSLGSSASNDRDKRLPVIREPTSKVNQECSKQNVIGPESITLQLKSGTQELPN